MNNCNEYSIRAGYDGKEFINGPYTVGPTPVPKVMRSHGFDFAVFNGYGHAKWSGTKAECDYLAEKWNIAYATHLMTEGTKAARV